MNPEAKEAQEAKAARISWAFLAPFVSKTDNGVLSSRMESKLVGRGVRYYLYKYVF
jgi:hypothetical protein